MMNDDKIKINSLEIYMKELQNNFSKFEKKFDKLETSIADKFSNLEETLENKFVNKKEFGPIQKIVYSGVGAILLWFLGKLTKLI